MNDIIKFRVVADDWREGQSATYLPQIDWMPVIAAIVAGHTLELTIPPHPRYGDSDDHGRKTLMLLRNWLVKTHPTMRLRSRSVDSAARRVVVWAVWAATT